MILTDTGFWLALLNRRDQNHTRAKLALERCLPPFVTTWPVLTETCHLALRLGVDVEIGFLEAIDRGAVKMFDLGPPHLPRIVALMKKYRDLPMDLADASLVIAAEDLRSGDILSTDDRDFRTYRWKSHKPFRNLLLG